MSTGGEEQLCAVGVDHKHHCLDQLRYMHLTVVMSCLCFLCPCTLCSSPYGYAPDSNQAPPDEPPPNHILLYTVFNPMYTINVVST